MHINCFDENNKISERNLNLMQEILKLILQEEFGNRYSDNIEISINIVNEDEIKHLNEAYRNIDKVTDVLSFPQYENSKQIECEMKMMSGVRDILLGDVVICYEKLIMQAEEYDHSVDRELLYLYTHSILHLLGYDHEMEKDKIKMRSKEKKIMNIICLEDGKDI